ncbi:glycosyltransferase [Sinorhizobium meliloti]|uniref:glycosyltransferase n=1 Tax=Rhizobium meliloti TaxID=382 RepID=UPI000FD84566|nr:glycosyltransferase [Sinorhizobium meliloti]MDW9366827.1 glycosyltransferase [Sinorhizobium meliloti]MDW9407048.1 glycosyltransferase [Sinorhizobium meliloti]MDW9428139.1 glycosyltransferase [Sinorhizobium meliloti]MDW9452220.1 glycosyltransferase [Sinorhizobium meliloti]MDW9465160.1 glycosyltransferase [Sinorhizobium meliloti]
MKRRTLVASEFNAKDRAHFALEYEFCRIVAECEDGDLIAPGIDNYLTKHFHGILPKHDHHNVQRDFNRLTSAIRKGLGLRNAPTMERVRLTQDYDLFFFVAWSPQSLVELSRIHDWRGRCKVAVAYLFELWSSTLEQDRQYLKLLDQFDYVFLLHSACIPRLPQYTRAPCSFLATGVDGLVSTPYLSPVKRVVDVYSFGNRATKIHRQLLNLAHDRDFFYLYDTLASTDSRVKDWHEHRLLLANIIKRTRYFMAFSPAALANSKSDTVAGEQVLPARLFEGAAGGAIMLGSAPQCAEFGEHFDWQDAVIEISPDSSSIADVIGELDANARRTELLRRTNAVRCLEMHDWVYRWEHILVTIGMEPLPQLRIRKSLLRQIAADAMALA